MSTFLHSGDLGDIILGLPTMRALGGGTLYLGPSTAKEGQETFPRETMTPRTVKFLKSLLEYQDYIKEVKPWYGESIRHDLNAFRWMKLDLTRSNLCYAHLYAFGLPPNAANEGWIDVPLIQASYDTVVARSPRHQNLNFDYYKWAGRRGVFVGLQREYDAFIMQYPGMSIYKANTANAMQVAQIIKAGLRFVGNQSFPFALAEAMKKPIILEVDPECPNVIFDRNCNVT